jgi:hypothetical protein
MKKRARKKTAPKFTRSEVLKDRREQAEAELAVTFSEIRDGLDAIDRLVISLCVDVAGRNMSDTCEEVAKIAKHSFMMRSVLPKQHRRAVSE